MLGIYYEYYYVILLIVLFSNFVLFKKKYFYLIKIIFGIKELKIYNEKLCIVFVYLMFYILLFGFKSFIIIFVFEIIGVWVL